MFLGIFVAFFLCFASEIYAQASYTISDLGFEGIPWAINNSGQIAGRLDTVPNSRPFLYSAGSITDLGQLLDPGTYGEAKGINSTGQVAGYGLVNGKGRAFVYTNGTINVLSWLPGGSAAGAFAINDSGDVVGRATDSNFVQHAVLWRNGTMTDLGSLPFGHAVWPQGINNSGQITGFGDTIPAGTQGSFQHAFLYANGSITDLGTLCGFDSQGTAINNLGQITGVALACGGGTHAFLYSNGSMTDLGTLPGTFFSYGWAINDFGQVTGTSYYTASGNSHAFVYSGGAMKDLNDLIPSGSGWVLSSGISINRYGQIAGYGLFNGTRRIFLLTPTSDTFPPVTAAVQSPAPNSAAWNKTNVTISLTATDNSGGSGVKQIQITLSGSQTGSQLINGTAASVMVTAEGLTTVTWYAADIAGNVETPKSLAIRIDRTAPTVAGLPTPGCVIWPPDKHLVQFMVTGSDALSGLNSLAVSATSSEPIAPGDIVVNGGSVQLTADRNSASGRVYTIIATTSDLAGNTTTATGTCTVPHDQSQ